LSYVTHARAALTVEGRLKIAQLVVHDGWAQARVAERFQIARGTVSKWVTRYRVGGQSALRDRSSRPHSSPNRSPRRVERRVVSLRVTRRWGAHRIAAHLRLAQSTVSKILARYRVPLLGHIDLNTGVRVRRPQPVRYEREKPGELVHVDVKKLGRIPDGGGHRTLGRQKGRKVRSGAGYAYLHSAIDDCSRLVYSEIHADEKKETAAGFWARAAAFYAAHGITVERVMTDNGSCYRSKLFNEALGTATHKYTRPYRPQTNGKIERFHRTLATEWAYAHHYSSEQARINAYPDWLHHYNHHRPHTGLRGRSPIERVHNVSGKNT
jgi:transposase InsO family protein